MEHLLPIVVGFLIAALLGKLFIPGILVVAHQKRLFDVPDERKVHTSPIPRLGGVTFFPLECAVANSPEPSIETQYFLPGDQ